MAFFLLAITFFYIRNRNLKIWAGMCLLLGHLYLGCLLGHYAQLPNGKSFFWNCTDFTKANFVHLRIEESLQEKNSTWRTTAQVLRLRFSKKKSILCSGKVLIYWPKRRNVLKPKVFIGDELLIKNQIIEMPKAAFPDGFDYKAVMRYRNVQHQVFLDSSSYVKLPGYSTKLSDLAKRVKSKLIEYIEKKYPKDISALVQSLCLGHKDNLDSQDTLSFAKSGTMHVLAVSGLHVGMVYLLLNFLFSLGGYSSRLKRISPFLILTVLWLYAFVTGLGASVIRASLMFTIIELGRTVLASKGNIFNSVFAAAYIQLLIFPLNLIEVGFQLSYLAVLSILFFYPKIFPLLNPPSLVLHKAWQLVCVSIAATIGTLPVTFYFFHTFPVWFVLSNVFLVPIGMICLAIIILGFILLEIPFIGDWVIWINSWVLRLLLRMVHFFAELPYSQVKDIYILSWEVFFYLLFTPLVTYGLVKRKRKLILSLVTLILLYSTFRFFHEDKCKNECMVITSELRNVFLVSIVNKGKMTNISKPIRRSLSDSLFQFQKGFMHQNSIKNATWQFFTGQDTILGEDWKLIGQGKNRALLLTENFKPTMLHWKSNRNNQTRDSFIHIMQHRYFRYSDTNVDYILLKNSYHMYK